MSQFSKDLYDKHDDPAKQVAIGFLKQQEHTIVDTQEAYGSHDFITKHKNKQIKVEVEQKVPWKTKKFPFSSHNVPYRKQKSCADVFIQINAEGNALAMCSMDQVKSSPVIQQANWRVPDGTEKFFSVPCSSMRYYYLENGLWINPRQVSSSTPSKQGNRILPDAQQRPISSYFPKVIQ
jgi:Holliday junction resolvase-like predicted endonuclease